MDFAKVFDFLPYDLLLGKLNSDGFSFGSLKLALHYLPNYKRKKNSVHNLLVKNLLRVISFRASLVQNLFVRFFIMNDIGFASMQMITHHTLYETILKILY